MRKARCWKGEVIIPNLGRTSRAKQPFQIFRFLGSLIPCGMSALGQRATLCQRYAAAGFERTTRRWAAGPSHKQDRASGGHLERISSTHLCT
jgi:hypothetical protein